MLLQEFVNDFTNGRYDTVNKLVLIDDLTHRHTHLLPLKEVLLQEILSSSVRCNTATLTKYQLYSNSYCPSDFVAPHTPAAPTTKRKRTSAAAPCRTAAPPCKRRRINSVCVAVINKKSIFYKC
jgi:hypothetical protein